MNERKALHETEKYVRSIYRNRFPMWRSFHNLEHTINVVNTCELLGQQYAVTPAEIVLLKIAGWFHDVGYYAAPNQHEEASVKIAQSFLPTIGIHSDSIALISSWILATKPRYQPTSLAEEIIRDADLRHLSQTDYLNWAGLLKNEKERDLGRTYDLGQWATENIRFIQEHRYHTDYARQHWQSQKQENIRQLMATLMEVTHCDDQLRSGNSEVRPAGENGHPESKG